MSPALLAVVSIIAQILTGLIPGLNLTGLSATLVKLIDEILTQLPTLWSAIKSGSGATMEVTAALVSIQTIAKEAASDPGLNPAVLAWIDALDTAAQKALAADTAAQANVDPASLTDISPV